MKYYVHQLEQLNFAAWPRFRWRRQWFQTRVVLIFRLPICLVSIQFKSQTTEFICETSHNLIKFDTFLIAFRLYRSFYYYGISEQCHLMTVKVRCINCWFSEQVFSGKTNSSFPFIDVIIFIWLINFATFNTLPSGLVRHRVHLVWKLFNHTESSIYCRIGSAIYCCCASHAFSHAFRFSNQ